MLPYIIHSTDTTAASVMTQCQRYWSCREDEYSSSLHGAYSSLVGHLQKWTDKTRQGRCFHKGMQDALKTPWENSLLQSAYHRSVPEKLMFKLWRVWVRGTETFAGKTMYKDPEASESRAYLGILTKKLSTAKCVMRVPLEVRVGPSWISGDRPERRKGQTSRHVSEPEPYSAVCTHLF